VPMSLRAVWTWSAQNIAHLSPHQQCPAAATWSKKQSVNHQLNDHKQTVIRNSAQLKRFLEWWIQI
jgi:hypothetical protein